MGRRACWMHVERIGPATVHYIKTESFTTGI